MNEPHSADSTAPHSAALPGLAKLCHRFELAWKIGQPPSIEAYLGDVSGDEQPALLRRLIQLDILYRRRHGDSPRPEDYSRRFAVLDPDWLANELTASPPASPGPASLAADSAPTKSLEGGPAGFPAAVLCCPHCHNPLPLGGEQSQEMVCRECGSSFRVEKLQQPSTLAEARRLGRFQLMERVGQGSYGAVWRARDTALDRIVALKIPHASLLSSASDVERFQREARAAAQLRHPGIVRLYEVATLQGGPVLVSDFIEGVPLKDLLAVKKLTFQEAAGLIAEVAEALDYAHAMGLVHRDIKPGNIMVEYGRPGAAATAPSAGPAGGKSMALGKPILVDFGLALREEAEIVMTVDGQIIGTPAYMSPEQAAGRSHRVDRRSDVYGLGVVLYQLLCGELPFRGSKAMLVHQVLYEEPRPPRRLNDKIPRDLETICLKAMAKEPPRRYATARELADDLRRFLKSEPIQARPAGRGERLWRWCRRNPAVACLLGVVAFLLVGGTLLASYLAVRATKGEREQREARLLSDRQRYGAEINLAQRDWKNAQPALVQDLLTRQEPRTGAPDLRGFEWYYLQRLCQLDLGTLRGHQQSVRCLAFSPDGRWLASAGEDRTVWVWDMATGQERLTLSGHTQPVWSVAFSPDGQQLASASRAYDQEGEPLPGEVKIWDWAAGKEISALKGPKTPVWSLAFSPDGRRLACAGGRHERGGKPLPGEVTIWDLATEKELFNLKGHEAPVWSVAFSGDGRRLASASEDQTVRVWDADKDKPRLLTLREHTAPVYSVAFSPDSKRLASAGFDRTVRVWDAVQEGPPLLTLRGHAATVQSVAFSADGRRLASASEDRSVKIWDTTTGVEAFTLCGHAGGVYSVAFSPDGWRLASAGADQTVKVWDATAEREPLTFGEQTHEVHGLAFSPDGRRLAAAGADCTVRIWDTTLGLVSLVLRGHIRPIQGVAFSPPDGRRLASAGMDHTVRVWDAATGEGLLILSGHTKAVFAVAFSPDGHLASAGQDQTVKLWDLETGGELGTLRGHRGPVRGIAFSLDGRRLASAGEDRDVKIWDPATRECLLTLGGHAGAVTSVAFSPDGHLLASGSEDRTVKFWDLATKENFLTLRRQTDHVLGVAFSPDGGRLASAGADRTIKIWDPITGQELFTLEGHESHITSVAFSPEGWRLASGSLDKTVKVWDARPRTTELSEQRQALSLLESLSARPLSKAEVLRRLRTDPTISGAVRLRALEQAESYWQARLRHEADRLVQSRSTKFLLKQDLLESIRTDASVAEPLRQEASALAEHYIENPKSLNRVSREVVRQPDKEPAVYGLALRQAIAACRLAPEQGSYVTTLGMAQYRVGEFDKAVQTLTRAGQLNADSVDAPLPADLAFLAMAQYRLGKKDQAQATLQRLQETMQKPQWAKQAEAQAFLHEAETLINSSAAEPKK